MTAFEWPLRWGTDSGSKSTFEGGTLDRRIYAYRYAPLIRLELPQLKALDKPRILFVQLVHLGLAVLLSFHFHERVFHLV